jgi:hypothetical protein
MNKTIILCTHNRPIHAQTVISIRALNQAGAALIDHADAPTDVTLGRNLGLSAVCDNLDRMPAIDTVLMVDDDMVFTIDDAGRLVEHTRLHRVAASAMYATTAGALAACRLDNGQWMTGLGLLAIPADLLLALRGRSQPFEFFEETRYAFTSSGACGGHYLSEDFMLCKNLGGVDLLPIPVGHMKQAALYPDDETVAAIREGRRLTTELDPLVLSRLVDPVMARSEYTPRYVGAVDK